MRLNISSLTLDPKGTLDAVRAHWGIESSFRWTLDVTFDEDGCRTRNCDSVLNLAVIRYAALNALKADASKGSMRKKRMQACVDPQFRSALFASYRFRISPW